MNESDSAAPAYLNGTIAAYLDKLAGPEPEPGGGSVAALVGALAAGLVTMVTSLTRGKEKFAAVEADMGEIEKAAETLRARLGEFVSLDAQAYRKVAVAMKMPRDTEEQKRERVVVLQAALKGAADVPLRIAEAAAAVARLTLPAAEKGNPHAVSDAGVAVVLAEAAAQAAALNVKINLAWIEDEAFNREAWARVESVLSETARLRETVLSLTYSKL
jgi:formiminotetrahydrofolate cyclodeaminase